MTAQRTLREVRRRLLRWSCGLGLHRWVETKRSVQPVLASWYVVERCCWCHKVRGQFKALGRWERRMLGLPVDGGRTA